MYFGLGFRREAHKFGVYVWSEQAAVIGCGQAGDLTALVEFKRGDASNGSVRASPFEPAACCTAYYVDKLSSVSKGSQPQCSIKVSLHSRLAEDLRAKGKILEDDVGSHTASGQIRVYFGERALDVSRDGCYL